MAKIAGLTLEIGGEVTPLNKALTSVNKSSRDLKSELRDVERLLKLDPTNTDLLAQKQKILGESVEVTKEKIDKLKEAERQAQEQFKKGEVSEEQYRALQREVIKAEEELKGLEDRIKTTHPKLEKFGEKAKEVGGNIKNVGDILTKGVTLPIAAAGTGLVALGSKFDDVYDNIRIGTGATGEALEELNEDFRQIAKEVPASLDDVGKAVADYNTRLGLSGQALQTVSKQTLELARITDGDLNAIIEETSQTFQAFNLSAEDYEKSLDFIFKVSQSTGIGITRLQQNMVKFSPTLKTLGFDFQQSATFLGQLDKAGVDVEQALAGLTKSMGTLAKQGVTDANKAIQILFDRIKKAPNDMAGANAALEIFGARAGPALAKSIREGKFEYQDLLATLQNSDETILGVADETKDFAERFIELKNNILLALEPLGEQLFNAINNLMPAFQNLIGFVSGLIEKFTNLSPEGKKVALIMLGIIAAIGPLLSILGTAITLIGSMSLAAAGLGISLSAMLGWIGLIALAITGITALIVNIVTAQDDQVKQSQQVVEQIQKERDAYQELKSAQEEKMESNLAEISYTQDLWKELQTLVGENGNVTEANRARAEFIMGELNSALGTELKFIDNKIVGLETEGQKIDELIAKKRAQIMLESMEPQYKEAIINSKKKEADQSKLTADMIEQENKVKQAQEEFDKAKLTRDANLISSKWKSLEDEKKILNNQEKAYLLNKNVLDEYYTDIGNYENGSIAATQGNYAKLEDIVVGSTQRTYTTANDLVGKSAEEQKGILGEQYASALVALADYAENHKKGVEGYTQEGLEEAQRYATSAKVEYEKVGGAIVDGTIEGVDGRKFNLKSTLDALFKLIPDWAKKLLHIESPSKVMRDEVGKYIVEGLAQGIKDNQGTLKKEMENMVDTIKTKITEMQKFIDGIEKEIKQLESTKEKSLNKDQVEILIKAKKAEIDVIKDNIKALQEEQKEYEERAKAYIEAAELINKGLGEKTDDINLTKEKSSLAYKLWETVYSDTATEAEKLQKQEESLSEQYQIQSDMVDATQSAYELMVEQYGEAYDGSRKLYNQLQQEKIAYEELYNSIMDVRKAKGENVGNSQYEEYGAAIRYRNLLNENYKTLVDAGISPEDVFAAAKKASGLEKAEATAKNITINQTIEKNQITPSEIRQAARDGAMLATKGAYE